SGAGAGAGAALRSGSRPAGGRRARRGGARPRGGRAGPGGWPARGGGGGRPPGGGGRGAGAGAGWGGGGAGGGGGGRRPGRADRAPPAERTAVRWAEHGITPEKALVRLVALRILDERSAALARRRLGAAARPSKGAEEATAGVRVIVARAAGPDLSPNGTAF